MSGSFLLLKRQGIDLQNYNRWFNIKTKTNQ